MPLASEREFQRALRQRQFARAYYLYGEDDFLKQTAVHDLTQAAVDPATRDFNFDVVRAQEVSAEALESLLHTPPMMAERRVIVVRDANTLRRDARQALDRYLAEPAADTVLVLVAPPGAKEDKALMSSATAVAFPPLTPDRVPKWIRHHATTVLGVEIDEEAVDLLLQGVGPDLGQLAAELEKAANYTGGKRVDTSAVSAVVGIRRGETLGDLLDAVADRDARRALHVASHVLSQPQLGAVPVLMALTAQTLAIAWGRAARARGLPPGALEREYFNLLRDSGAYPGRPWGEAVRTWARAIPRWDDASLDRALTVLFEAERAAKETRLSSEEQLVTGVVLALCGGAREAAA
jgi:DNA polymerase-3 subunit delta